MDRAIVICVDASVAAKWVLEESHSQAARSLYNDAVAAGTAIVAPRLLPFEVTNIVFKQMLRSGLPLAVAEILVDDLSAVSVEFHSPPDLHRAALRIANAHGLRASYDAHYLALAETLRCELWTDDQRLLRAVGKALPFVRWIGDYQTSAPLVE